VELVRRVRASLGGDGTSKRSEWLIRHVTA